MSETLEYVLHISGSVAKTFYLKNLDQVIEIDLLIPNETSDGKATPAHPVHQTTGQAFAPRPVRILAVWVDHGNRLRPGTDEGILATAANGRVQCRTSSHIDVSARKETIVVTGSQKFKLKVVGRVEGCGM